MTREEIEEIIETMCDDFCIWPTECPTEERLHKHCEECPLNRLKERSEENG